MSRKKITTEQWIQRAREIHGDKYDYSKVLYTKSSEKVCIICPKHGEFWQIANNHLKGAGCLKCKTETLAQTQRGNINSFIEKANIIHNFKYDYSKSIYGKNNKEKIIIICPKHGEFMQSPHDHLSGYGCLQCSRENNKEKQKDSLQDFIAKASKLHNNKYDYSKVIYENSRTPITIICKKHGEFTQTPNNHLKGRGCPKCQLKSQTKLYEELQKYFPHEKILFEVTKKTISWIEDQRIDIYFPKYNIAIEYNGEQHYIPIEHFGGIAKFQDTQIKDNLKRNKCKENNCTLFELKYDYSKQDFDNLVININNIISNYEH